MWCKKIYWINSLTFNECSKQVTSVSAKSRKVARTWSPAEAMTVISQVISPDIGCLNEAGYVGVTMVSEVSVVVCTPAQSASTEKT